MAKQKEEIKKVEKPEVVEPVDPFEWVSYDEMQKKIASGETLKEIHDFGDGKLYGFIKGKIK